MTDETDNEASTRHSPPARSAASRRLHLAFAIVSVLCFLWVIAPLFGDSRAVLERVEIGSFGWALATSIVVYASLGAVLATAWWWLAGVYDQRPSWLDGYTIWGRSQWAKYLPTNTLHLVSRQVLGRRAGLSHTTLAASAILETASLIAAAALAVAVLGTAAPPSALRASRWALLLLPLGLFAWAALEALARRRVARPKSSRPVLRRFLERLPRLTVARQILLLAGSLPLHGLFFLATAGLLIFLHHRGWSTQLDGAVALWLFPASWIVGTLTPGAPAGVGVREAVLVLGLAPSLGRTDAAALALALRAVTTGGDALTGAVAWALARRGARSGQSAAGTSTEP